MAGNGAIMSSADIFDQVERWMFDAALPYWAAHGVDHRYGGFIEILTHEGDDAAAAFKRTRVAGRQVYVFSHAATLGWKPGLEHVRHGLEYLTKRVFIDDEHGFARLTTRSGEVMDATPDLYDHAFILFGFSWAYRATGDAAIIPWMHKTVDCIERILTHPGGKGFWHDATKEGWRQQNPHMHLLEASLSAIEATGEDRFVAMASHVANLFRDHFFNRDHQLLLEFLPMTGARRRETTASWLSLGISSNGPGYSPIVKGLLASIWMTRRARLFVLRKSPASIRKAARLITA